MGCSNEREEQIATGTFETPDQKAKVIVVGPPFVGKTTMI